MLLASGSSPIDVPSGVSGDAGAVAGPAVRARCDRDVLLQKGSPCSATCCGAVREVVPAEIGFGRFVEAAGGGTLHENGPALWDSEVALAGGEFSQASTRTTRGRYGAHCEHRCCTTCGSGRVASWSGAGDSAVSASGVDGGGWGGDGRR